MFHLPSVNISKMIIPEEKTNNEIQKWLNLFINIGFKYRNKSNTNSIRVEHIKIMRKIHLSIHSQ